ncbi:MAG: hypothetical protein H0U73_06190 [Tatlockia sp.]|nr:hypothetical protein [Tatlockia sp.]
MTLEQLLNLLAWFEKIGGSFPSLGQPSLEMIKEINKDLIVARTTVVDQDLLAKVEKFLNLYLLKIEPFNLFKASLQWLRDASGTSIKNKIIAQQKIGVIFSRFLDLEPEEAIEFYRQELKMIYPSGGIIISNYENEKKFKVSKKEIEKLVIDKLENFKEIKRPLSLLLHVDLSNAVELSVYIIWLLRKGESVQSILETGVLQSFLIANIHRLNDETNPVQSFYCMLAEFKEAEQLSILAAKTRVKDEAFKNYNLHGNLCAHEKLDLVQVTEPSFIGILDRRLFNKLYSIFGINFLYDSFNHLHQSNENNEVLTEALNSKYSALSAIPQLINKILSSYEEESLENRYKRLAKLISKETFLELLSVKNHLIMLYLLPHREDLITEEQFNECIRNLVEDPSLAPLKKWDLMMNMVRWTKNKDSIEPFLFLYQSMVILVLKSTENLFEIEKVIEPLCLIYGIFAKVSEHDELSITNQLIIENREFLQTLSLDCDTQWEKLCKDRLKNPNFNLDDYNLLQESWLSYFKKRNFFQRLFSLPKEDLSFNDSLILQAKSLNETDFALLNLANLLFDLYEKEESIDSLSDRSTELLSDVVTILRHSNPILTDQIIVFLNIKSLIWVNLPRPHISLIEEAVLYNNLELITYLLKQEFCIPLEVTDILSALKLAITHENLPIIKLFLAAKVVGQFSEGECYSLYHRALEGKSSSVFTELLKHPKLLQFNKKKQLSLIAEAAFIVCDWAIPMLINVVDFRLNNEDLDELLSFAVTNKQWRCVEVLCNLMGGLRPTAIGLEIAANDIALNIEDQGGFIRAALRLLGRKTILQRVNSLMDLDGSYEILKLLINHSGENKLTSDDLISIFQIAIAGSHPAVASLIATLTEDRVVISQLTLANLIMDTLIPLSDCNTIKYIYNSFKPDLHPHVEWVSKFFELAITNKDLAVFKVLSKHTIQQLDANTLLNYYIQASKNDLPEMAIILRSALKTKEFSSTWLGGHLNSYLNINDLEGARLLSGLSQFAKDAKDEEELYKEREDTLALKELQLKVQKATADYLKYNKEKCYFSIFHVHGETGRLRASSFQNHFAKIENYADARQELLEYLMDSKNGNTYPHSYRTMLLDKLHGEPTSLQHTSRNYDHKLYLVFGGFAGPVTGFIS